jgi:recombination protein RecA
MAANNSNTDKNSEKLKALKLTIDKIDKDFGKGSVMMMNER